MKNLLTFNNLVFILSLLGIIIMFVFFVPNRAPSRSINDMFEGNVPRSCYDGNPVTEEECAIAWKVWQEWKEEQEWQMN